MNVAAVIVTRGDVDLAPVLDSFPDEWERVVWDNGSREVRRHKPGGFSAEWRGNDYETVEDLAVYGRYAVLRPGLCDGDVIVVQDDDVLLAQSSLEGLVAAYKPGHVVCNMPQRFRDTGFYDDHALVGFGAIFHRDLPGRAFERWYQSQGKPDGTNGQAGLFLRTCDIVFTALTPRILVDVPYTDREFASAPNRMWKQPDHLGERTRMLDLVRQVRDQ